MVKKNKHKLPDIFGKGMLLAFSGLDGRVNQEKEAVGAAVPPELGIGFRLHLPDDILIWAETETNWEYSYRTEIALNDLVVIEARHGDSEAVKTIAFSAAGADVIAGVTAEPFGIHLKFLGHGSGKIIEHDERVVLTSRAGYRYVILKKKAGNRIHFSFSWARTEKEAAVKAARFLDWDLKKAVESKEKLYSSIRVPQKLSSAEKQTYLKAISILRANVISPDDFIPYYWATPGRYPFKMLWLWDSVFQALGYAYFAPRVAEEGILALFHHQKSAGFIPHMISRTYLGPHSQPPLISWGVWNTYQVTGNTDFLKRAYPGLEKYLLWFVKNRRNKSGLFGWYINAKQYHCHCGESGTDNNPAYDKHAQLDCVDLCCYLANDIDCLDQIGAVLGCSVSEKLIAVRQSLMQNIQKLLWNEQERFFMDRVPGGEFTGVKTALGFLPLFAGLATGPQAKSLVEHLRNKREFWTEFPLPSVSRDHPSFDKNYWRGCVWLNVYYLVILGLERYGFNELADNLRKILLQKIAEWHAKTGCIFEAYDPDDEICPDALPNRGAFGSGRKKEGGVAANFNWSAAIFVRIANELSE